MSGSTALIIGASGQTGRRLLKELLASPSFSQISEYGRKVTDLDSISTGKDKLQQKVIDFEKLNESGLKDGKWDVVFITLGTTRKNAGSAEAFEKIDREYVLNAAREAKASDKDQRLVYLSSSGANPNSFALYTKSKGLTEVGLASLGYKDTIIFRPAMLTGLNRDESRPLETAARYVTGALSRLSSSIEIKVDVLAKAMANAGRLGSASLPDAARATKEGKEDAPFTVIGNACFIVH
ncbi:hypothetical protein BT96DRAFT_1026011 [Gymnopus androsaceus JB14]|uniref:NAD(P)-binding domain-containing protein n=1 Tax=Gymnopus androsaceus JB14 TaxID=1447944 RepID=A0A6A4GNE9_9AGAR|nr:hypothetical protein BT96DRAFT_1026011 [Gymnopus androsaceus JB14]